MKKFTIALFVFFAAPLLCVAAEAPDLSGAELYTTFCASCHGAKAHGDGPVVRSLKRPVPDLTLLATRNKGEFPASKIYRIVDGRLELAPHGSRDMPVWGRELYAYDGEDPLRRARVQELITRLVEYLRSIQAPKEK